MRNRMRSWGGSSHGVRQGLAFGATLFVALVALAADKGAAERAASSGPDTWFAETVSQGDGGVRVMQTWSKGRKLRAETTIAGQLLLTIVNGDTYYNLIPSAGVGIAIARAPRALEDDRKGGRPFGRDTERILARGAEKAGSERLMGKDLAVYRISNGDIREEVWATDDAEKLPVKLVYTDRKEGETAETLFNWIRGVQLSDAFFEPDPRLQIEKVSYEDFAERVKEGKAVGFPPLFTDLLSGRPERGAN